MMCRALGVSRSGYYDWRERPESDRARRHRALTEKIRYFHQASRETYGSPRIHTDLIESGERVGENTVALLMQRAGIVPKMVRKFRVTTDSRKTVPAPNRLAQQFAAARPNQRWVSDITFIPTRAGWLYLAVIIDLYSRAVIGWAMHRRMKTALVTDALNMALMRRKVRSPLLLHSDQGSQYAASDYRAILAVPGIWSMDQPHAAGISDSRIRPGDFWTGFTDRQVPCCGARFVVGTGRVGDCPPVRREVVGYSGCMDFGFESCGDQVIQPG